jgi:signal transduction histidine kinase/ligand-binding sensor domain-containing protein
MIRALLGVTLLTLCGQAWCMEADLTLQQLNHKAWAVADGAPGAIYAITQTTDGTLWVAGPSGLSRFDGIHFVRYDGTLGRHSRSTDIAALTASPDGGLWIGFGLGGITLVSPTGTTQYDENDGLSAGTVNSIVMDRSRNTYAATTHGLYQLLGHRWQLMPIEADPGARVSAASVDRADTLWVLTDRYLWARQAGESHFKQIATRSNPRRIGPNALAVAPDGGMWALNLNRLSSLVRAGAADGTLHRDLPEVALSDTTTNPGMAFDRDGNLWLGGAAVRRLSASSLQGNLKTTAQQMESFTLADGLTGSTVTCFFEDREGNMWVGTYSGLDRFTHSNVVRIRSTGTFGVAVAAEGGSVWLSAVNANEDSGSRYPLNELQNGSIVSTQRAPHYTAGFRSNDGSLWFGSRRGIVQYKSGERGKTIPLPSPDIVQAMAQDQTGTIWVSVSRKGVFRYSDGQWTAGSDQRGVPRSTPLVITTDPKGRLFLGYRDERVVRIDGPAVTRFGEADGLKVGNVTAIATRGDDGWIGGDEGLAHFDGARFTRVASASGDPFTGISGIVAPDNGDLWLNAGGGIVHLPRAELERVVREPNYAVHAEVFDRLDGLQGYSRQIRPSPSAFEGTDGRLWFATQVGLVSINPAHVQRNTLPPPVTIWSIDDRSVQFPSANVTRLPMHTRTVRIEYTAASLTVPERVRFRYKLDGLDQDWQDVADRREATYTNLTPGRYSFHVIASNNDGVWNNAGASLSFEIAPAFYQTHWFYAFCALLFLAFLWLLYVVRIRQVRAQVHARLQERLAERERIARELHDTLLQSVQGLVLRFRAAVSRLPKQEPVRTLLEDALDRADDVVIEGRDRVKDLRSATGSDLALPQAIAALGAELAEEQSIDFRSTVEGTPRDLHPIVGEEAMFIAREALTNAFRHAAAKQIEAEISYAEAELQIRIRDDGRGIDTDVLREGGKDGHWGLLGMRERARKIRGTLTVWSKPGAGTEVDLRLPAHIAYQSRRRVSLRENLVSRLS